jgi:hypothetical protein
VAGAVAVGAVAAGVVATAELAEEGVPVESEVPLDQLFF